MGKSKAEIQRQYRERKKLREGEAYLKRERERVKGYYVPIAEMPKKKAKQRRKKIREYVGRHRMEKKLKAASNTQTNQIDTCNIIQDFEVTSSNSSSLIVRLPSIDQRIRSRRRISRATAKCMRSIEKLKEENTKLSRKVKTVSKRYERLVSKTKQPEECLNTSANTSPVVPPLTPRKRTSAELRAEGLTPRKVSKKIHDQLLLANVLTEELGQAWKSNGVRGKKVISKLIFGKLVEKYKMKKVLGVKTGIRRQNFKDIPTSKKLIAFPKIQKKVEAREALRKDVISFLSRDDNSRMMPGKNDKKKTEDGHKQKRVLNDNMGFLHMKFKAETSKKISLATFCRLRPKHICLTKYISRNKCLCQKHQNMALALKNMKSAGANISTNPDEFGRYLENEENNQTVEDLLSEISGDQIKYEQ